MQEGFSHLSRGVLTAVMVLRGPRGRRVIREDPGLKDTDNNRINALKTGAGSLPA